LTNNKLVHYYSTN